MRKTLQGIYFSTLAAFLALAPSVPAASTPSRNIVATPHNLSVSGGRGAHDLKSTQEVRVCIFCHTPHHAQADAPLWSREVSDLTIYIPYQSPTLRSNPQQPTGASRVCLSCHDGTIALGLLAGGLNLDSGMPVIPHDTDPALNANLGTDLSDDHPISFPYLPGLNPELNDPSTLPGTIQLEDRTSLECTACHDPHNNEFGNFLVIDSTARKDALCTTCHRKAGWENTDAAHRTGGTRYSTVAAEVAANGCRNCHLPHSSAGRPYLLRAAEEEKNCLSSCHKLSPYKDVWSEFAVSAYHHPVEETQNVHQANPATKVEDLPVSAASKHVECVDCHNPHQAGWTGAPMGATDPLVPPPSSAPDISGVLRGVRGIDKTGGVVSPARFEYEICFKCHAGISADQFVTLGTRPLRQFETFNQSLRFAYSNPSYHPVSENRLGSGQSLLPELRSTMIRIYCVDCHSPHGSNEPHLLTAANGDTYPAGGESYPLCFRCHDRDYLLTPSAIPSAASVNFHRSHVVTHHTPCAACHDPHGVPAARGATPANAANLINFDLRYAGTNPVYDATLRSCSVSCHTINPRSL